MSNIAEAIEQCKEETKEKEDVTVPDEAVNFFDGLEEWVRDGVRIVIERAIQKEFNEFIGCLPYQRSKSRSDYRNGIFCRDYETRFGVIRDIPIPRSRNGGFFPSIFRRWQRRENKIVRIISDMFIRGISTRKIKVISKAIWGKEYSASTVSNFNKTLKEDFISYFNRPIEEPIRYLFLDAVNLKVRRNWISKEALLCAIGITQSGRKEFLGFILGGRESTRSWEDFLIHLKRRGLIDPACICVDGNPGLLAAINVLFPGIPLQRCMVHKVRNISIYCPKTVKASVVAEAKRIFYATSRKEAMERFNEWKDNCKVIAPNAVKCLEKDLDSCLTFYSFPYRHWIKIRTTNIIERAFKEFRRRIRVMETFPTEESCIRIMFALAKLLNETWKYKQIKGF